MKEELLKTVVENKTEYDLSILLCVRDGLVPKAEVKQSRRLNLWHSLHYTFQDYVVEPKHGTTDSRLKVSLNSDICCDYERIVVKVSIRGELVVDKEARQPWSLWGMCSFRLPCRGLFENAVNDETQKPSREELVASRFGNGYQLIPFFVDGTLSGVETVSNFLKKRAK